MICNHFSKQFFMGIVSRTWKRGVVCCLIDHISKHLKVCKKYSAMHHIFTSSWCLEMLSKTLFSAWYNYYFQNLFLKCQLLTRSNIKSTTLPAISRRIIHSGKKFWWNLFQNAKEKLKIKSAEYLIQRVP